MEPAPVPDVSPITGSVGHISARLAACANDRDRRTPLIWQVPLIYFGSGFDGLRDQPGCRSWANGVGEAEQYPCIRLFQRLWIVADDGYPVGEGAEANVYARVVDAEKPRRDL
jgi:hypothetical protein